MISREYDGTASGARDLGARIAERLQAGQQGAVVDAADVLLALVYELPAEHAHAAVTALLERLSRIVAAATALVKARGRFHTQREYQALAAACRPDGPRIPRSEALSAVRAVMVEVDAEQHARAVEKFGGLSVVLAAPTGWPPNSLIQGDEAALNKALQFLADESQAELAHDAAVVEAGRYRFLRDLPCCSLSISRNDHAASYMTAAEAIASDAFGNFADDPLEQIEAMQATNTIWSLQIYPRTPIGFDVYHGATLESVIDRARADYAPPQAGEGG